MSSPADRYMVPKQIPVLKQKVTDNAELLERLKRGLTYLQKSDLTDEDQLRGVTLFTEIAQKYATNADMIQMIAEYQAFDKRAVIQIPGEKDPIYLTPNHTRAANYRKELPIEELVFLEYIRKAWNIDLKDVLFITEEEDRALVIDFERKAHGGREFRQGNIL